jgi:hypothetical protein
MLQHCDRTEINNRIGRYVVITIISVYSVALCVLLTQVRFTPRATERRTASPPKAVIATARVPDQNNTIEAIQKPNQIEWNLQQVAMGVCFFIAQSHPIPLLMDVQIDHPLSPDEQNKFHFAWINDMCVNDGAADDLFDDPKTFGVPFHIVLARSDNSHYVGPLRRNYPGLKCLSINQKVPLSSEALGELARFDGLETLYLQCPITRKELQAKCFPTHLKILHLQECVDLNSMPNLEELWVTNTVVASKFLCTLKAPNLDDLELFDDRIEPGALSSLYRFKKLSYLELDHSSLNKENFQCALRLPYLTIRAPGPAGTPTADLMDPLPVPCR